MQGVKERAKQQSSQHTGVIAFDAFCCCCHRAIMAELASFLVRPLVVMLRDAQDASGPGYTLQDVLHGMSNNRQVRPAA
jgi:hypothetical protein